MADLYSLELHHLDPGIFRESLALTAASTGFTADLIEKDYYCSVILKYLYAGNTELVFKGGTCLGKVHADFYRLSEYLDFMIPTAVNTSRSDRSAAMLPIKKLIEALPAVDKELSLNGPLAGHNASKQYIGEVAYNSAIIPKQNTIKIEIGLREPLIKPAVSVSARTALIGAFTSPLTQLPSVEVIAMSMAEAYSEKIRAALTRREPAIRDFFDISYAEKNLDIDFSDQALINMAAQKISIPGNERITISAERRRDLEKQLNGQLKPVLRPVDFAEFDLDEAFTLACEIANNIADIRG